MLMNNTSSAACNFSCIPTSDGSYQGPYTKAETVIIVLVMAVIFVLAVIGNSFVILVISRVPSMRTPTNLLLLNLSAADLFVAIFFIFFSTIDMYITQRWVFGAFLCKVVSFMQLVGTRVSILSLAVISLERYLIVCRPKNQQLSAKHTKCIIAALWLVGIIAASPLLVVKELSAFSGGYFCAETGWTMAHREIYSSVSFLVLYLLPVVMMSAAYISVGATVWKSAKATSAQRRYAPSTSKRKVTKMCLALVISFVVSWAPIHALSLNNHWGSTNTLPGRTQVILFTLFTGIAASNCATNPILYCFMSDKFQKAFTVAVRGASFNYNKHLAVGTEKGEDNERNCRNSDDTMRTFNKTTSTSGANDIKRSSQHSTISFVSAV